MEFKESLLLLGCALLILLFADILHAGEIAPDGSTNTSVYKAPNGNTDIVNIANASANGVSLNNFQKMNVDQYGLILNNSTENVGSVLSGYIASNPNLTSSASYIVNQITGVDISLLNGPVEIAGPAAELIIVNPNGISCQGCGFVNTPKLSLSTGAFINGDPFTWDVKGGRVKIAQDGVQSVDGHLPNEINIVANNVDLEGNLFGVSEVKIIAGDFTYDYLAGTYEKKSGVINPRWAIDASALGSIAAGNITLIASGDDVGVRSTADIVASSDILISADGKIEFNNINAGRDVSLVGRNIANNNELNAGANININADYVDNSNSNILAGGEVSIESLQMANAGGLIFAGQKIYGRNINNFLGGIEAGDEILLLADNGVFDNRFGNILAFNDDSRIVIDSDQILNDNGSILSNENISLNINEDFIISGNITTGGFVDITAKSITNQGIVLAGDVISLIATEGNIVNESSLISDEFITLITTIGDVINQGEISSAKQITISANNFLNLPGAKVTSANNVILDAEYLIDTAGIVSSGIGYNIDVLANELLSYGQFYAGGDLTVLADNLILNRGLLYAADDINLLADIRVENMSGDIFAENGNINIFGANNAKVASFINSSGYIESYLGDVLIVADDFQNKRTSKQEEIYYGRRFEGLTKKSYQYVTDQRITGTTSRKSHINSGGDIDIISENFFNDASWITAGDNLYIEANSGDLQILSDSLESYRIIEYYACDSSSGCIHNWTQKYIYDQVDLTSLISAGGSIIGDIAGSINNVTVLEQNVAPEMEIKTGQYDANYPDFITDPSFDVDHILDEVNSSLFNVADESSPFLIISNRPYGSNEGLMASQYFLDLIDYDPEFNTRLLGDAFFESKFVSNQLLNLIGRKRINSEVFSESQQLQVLMANAVGAYQEMGLQVGRALTQEQILALSQDIIWWVEEEYNGNKVLVPVVYLAAGDYDLRWASIVADNIDFSAGGNINNNADIRASSDISLIAGGDIVNQGGFISSGNELSLIALTGDVVNESVAYNHDVAYRKQRSGIANKASFESGGDLNIFAGADISFSGADAISGGDVNLSANGDVVLNTIQLKNSDYHQHKKGYDYKESITHEASNLVAMGDVNILSSQDVNIKGSYVTASGDIDISAAGDVGIEEVYDSSYEEHVFNKKGKFGGLLGGSTRSLNRVKSSDPKGSLLQAGGDINLASNEADVNLRASQLIANQDININSAGKININPAKKLKQEESKTYKQKIGFSASKGRLSFAEVSASNEVSFTEENVGSGLFANNINLNAGDDINIIGSDIAANQTVSANSLADVNIVAGSERFAHLEESFKANLGFGLILSENEIGVKFSLESNIDNYKQESLSYQPSRILAENINISSAEDVLISSSILSAMNDTDIYAGEDLSVIALASVSETSLDSIRMELGNKATVSQNITTALQDLGNLADINPLKAIGDGFQFIADGFSLDGNREGVADLAQTIQAYQSLSDLLQGPVSAGISSFAGIDFYNQQSQQVVYIPSFVSSGNDLNIEVKGDAKLFSANLQAGGKVDIDVGGDMAIISPQNIYQSESSSFSVGVGGITSDISMASPNIAVGSGSSLNVLTENVSHILGGEQVDINVGGKLHNQAAVIASSNSLSGVDQGDLTINAADISYADNQDVSKNKDYNIGINTASVFDGTSKDFIDKINASYSDQKNIDEVKATIGGGKIEVSSGRNLNGLNRDINNTKTNLYKDGINLDLAIDAGLITSPVDHVNTTLDNLRTVPIRVEQTIAEVIEQIKSLSKNTEEIASEFKQVVVPEISDTEKHIAYLDKFNKAINEPLLGENDKAIRQFFASVYQEFVNNGDAPDVAWQKVLVAIDDFSHRISSVSFTLTGNGSTELSFPSVDNYDIAYYQLVLRGGAAGGRACYANAFCHSLVKAAYESVKYAVRQSARAVNLTSLNEEHEDGDRNVEDSIDFVIDDDLIDLKTGKPNEPDEDPEEPKEDPIEKWLRKVKPKEIADEILNNDDDDEDLWKKYRLHENTQEEIAEFTRAWADKNTNSIDIENIVNSRSELESLTKYKIDSREINDYLSGKLNLSPEREKLVKQYIANLDNMVDRARLKNNSVMYHIFVTEEEIGGAGELLNRDYYTSVTSDKRVIDNFAKIYDKLPDKYKVYVAEIEIPKNSKLYYIDRVASSIYNESEFLLPRNSSFKILEDARKLKNTIEFIKLQLLP